MGNLGDRMKENYENRYRTKLLRRTPVILRLDGKAFHTLTRGCNKPFDEEFNKAMLVTATRLFEQVQGAKLAYIQSDEISILLTDFDTLQTDAWFDYNLQKLCSVSAGYASVFFTDAYGKTGIFDCRAFNIPKEEVCNYFIWRQKDWERNSLQMLARTHFSNNELHGKKSQDIHDMLHGIGVNWADLEDKYKNGSCIHKYFTLTAMDYNKIFSKNRDIVEQYMTGEEKGGS